MTLIASDAAQRGVPNLHVDAASVGRILGYIIAALGGETDVAKLGLPSDTTPAMQVAVLTQEQP